MANYALNQKQGMSCPESSDYALYILRCSDSSLYTGVTTDLEKRIQTHTKGKGSRYVRSRLPCKLVYTEMYLTRSEAQKREFAIKQMTKRKKEQLIQDRNQI